MIRSYQGITPKLGERVYVDESAQVIGDVELGDHASVWMCAVIRASPTTRSITADIGPGVSKVGMVIPPGEGVSRASIARGCR